MILIHLHPELDMDTILIHLYPELDMDTILIHLNQNSTWIRS